VRTLFGLLFVLGIASAPADELLKNGDFSDGKTHWFGDGETPADLAPDNPLAPKDPAAAEKELLVELKPHRWTKVTQEFRTHAGQYQIRLRFKLSPDVKFSNDKEDYDKAYEDIGLWNEPTFTPVGSFLYGVIDSSKIFGLYSNCRLKKLQEPNPDLELTVNDTRTSDAKTLYLAFPPGSGTVVIAAASVSTP
jgi:hypothetical protein